MNSGIIYLDHQASTPVDPRVVRKMQPYFSEEFANPFSSHIAGLKVRNALEEAANDLAELIRCQIGQIRFVSGATEANRTALERESGPFFLSGLDHPSVLRPIQGKPIFELPVSREGRILWEEAESIISKHVSPREKGVLIVTHVHGEVGAIEDLERAHNVAIHFGLKLHLDAAQSLAFTDLEFSKLPSVTTACLSAHKAFGPKGVGVLFDRDQSEFTLGLGTPAVPQIVGFGYLAKILGAERFQICETVKAARDFFFENVKALVPECEINGPALTGDRHPGNLNLYFPGVQAAQVMNLASRVSCSTGSACSSGRPSQSLQKMGHSKERTLGSLRFGFGLDHSKVELQQAVREIAHAVKKSVFP